MLEKEAQEKGINIEALKEEQKKLAKLVLTKNAFDFSLASTFCGITTALIPKTNEILAATVILNDNLEVIESKYDIKKIKFPYIPTFRAYRELPVMISAYEKIEEQPDVIFIEAHGICHPRGLGLASHFGVYANKPVISITKNVLVGKEKNNEVVLNKKIVAKSIATKEGSNPIYVSTGHLISLNTAIEITKKCLKHPHKLPEPLVQARKLADKVIKEI